jgi:hypothetical protein
MFTTVAHIQSIDPAGVYTAINAALGEQHVRSTGTQIFVPELNQLVCLAAGVEIAVESFARVVAPSLRTLSRFEIEPFSSAAAGAVTPAAPHPVIDLRDTPVQLVKDEVYTAEINSNPAAAQIQWVVSWFADGPIVPVAGKSFSVRFTGATALVASTWTNVPITLNEDLPRGRYQVVGLRVRSAGVVAGRIVFVGGRWRPGVLGNTTQQGLSAPFFRYGEFGVFGEFEDTDLPSIDFLSTSADAAQDGNLDLIQLRAGPA